LQKTVFIFICVFFQSAQLAWGDVETSKVNTYSVTAPTQNQISVSKVNTYSVTAPIQNQISVSKVNTYTVTAPIQNRISLSKAVVYSVVVLNHSNQPSIYIMTRAARPARSNSLQKDFVQAGLTTHCETNGSSFTSSEVEPRRMTLI